jgi:hypothetical protein
MKSELPVKLVPFGEPLVANLRALKMQLHALSTSCHLEALDAGFDSKEQGHPDDITIHMEI